VSFVPRSSYIQPASQQIPCAHVCCGVSGVYCSRLPVKCDGTRWCTGAEVKGKLANGLGSQYSSRYLGTWCIQHYYRWCAHLGCHQSTELTSPADLNGLVRFAERRNLVSARVPSHFNCVVVTSLSGRHSPTCSVWNVIRALWMIIVHYLETVNEVFVAL